MALATCIIFITNLTMAVYQAAFGNLYHFYNTIWQGQLGKLRGAELKLTKLILARSGRSLAHMMACELSTFYCTKVLVEKHQIIEQWFKSTLTKILIEKHRKVWKCFLSGVLKKFKWRAKKINGIGLSQTKWWQRISSTSIGKSENVFEMER